MTFSLFALSDNRATATARANPAPVTPSASGGGLRFAVWPKAPKADVAPSASAQVFRGAVAGLPAFPQRLVPRHIVLFRVRFCFSSYWGQVLHFDI